VADRRQENSPELLTQRERKALQILAKEIVREAGLVPDPEAEAEKQRREELMDAYKRNEQTHIEFYKHMTTLSGASIVATIAVAGAFLRDQVLWPVYVSLAVIAVAMLMAGNALGLLSRNTGRGPMRGRFLRDIALDELVEHTQRWAGKQAALTIFVTVVWFVGFYLFLITTVLLLLQ
jgi:FtsH-binding integral membrane protein